MNNNLDDLNKQVFVLGKLVERLHRQLIKVNKKKLDHFDISPSDYHYFLTIDEHPGCTQSFLVSNRMVDKALVTRTIKKYLDKGLLIRKQSTSKKSSYNLYLSHSGKELVEEMRQCIQDTELMIRDAIGPNNFDALTSQLDTVSSYLKELE